MSATTRQTAQPKPIKPAKLPPNVHRIAGTELLYTTSGDERFTHRYAAKFAKGLPTVPGYSKWSLAEKREAVLLIDDKRCSPAVNTKVHPGIVSDWYWLKPVDASSPAGYAWGVFFGSGCFSGINRSLPYRALAVCRPLPASQQ